MGASAIFSTPNSVGSSETRRVMSALLLSVSDAPMDNTTSSRSRTWWAFAGFIAIAGFFLFTEHRAHLFGALPFLFLFACPLLHVFGHSGHGGHGGHERDTQETSNDYRHHNARAGDYEQPLGRHQHFAGTTRDDSRK